MHLQKVNIYISCYWQKLPRYPKLERMHAWTRKDTCLNKKGCCMPNARRLSVHSYLSNNDEDFWFLHILFLCPKSSKYQLYRIKPIFWKKNKNILDSLAQVKSIIRVPLWMVSPFKLCWLRLFRLFYIVTVIVVWTWVEMAPSFFVN